MATLDARRGYFTLAAKPGAIPELDGLRGIAIALVVLRHAARPIYDVHGTILQLAGWDFAVPLLNGWMGVDLFFVLSGFLITHHLLQRWPERLHAKFLFHYWLQRVLRTFPAYYAMLFIVATGALPFYQPEVEAFPSAVVQHVFFLQDYFGSEFMPAFWSLGVEEKFYLLCPFVLIWLRRYPRTRQIWILAMLALLPGLLRTITLAGIPDGFATYEQFFWIVRSPFHLALDGFWLGMLTALAYRWQPTVLVDRANARRLLLLGGTALITALAFGAAWFDAGYFWPSVLVLLLVPLALSAVMLAAITGQTPHTQWLRSRWLRFLAVISYSVYLTHTTMVPVATRLLEAISWYHSVNPLLQFVLYLPLFAALSVATGLILHFAVEKPFLLLKSRVRLQQSAC